MKKNTGAKVQSNYCLNISRQRKNSSCFFAIIYYLCIRIRVKLYIKKVKKVTRSRIISCVSCLDSQSNQSLRNKGTVPLSWPVLQNRLPVSSTPSRAKKNTHLSFTLPFFQARKRRVDFGRVGSQKTFINISDTALHSGPFFYW